MASFLKKLRGSSGAVDQTDGRTRTATGSTSNGQFSSHKWITTERKADGQQLVANKVDHVYKTLGSSPCNLISIFGRARQGKSFLMNCLSGEEKIFQISNEKESCTQGIDISEKWMTVTEFSKVDGGTSCEGKTKIGFVDAEGQGDRDVSYDANLVCPILLASKCVIFNWKGDLQKDHILSTLGIMTRAAKNVSLSEGELASGKKTFGHLHIIFRDWQAVDSDSDAVHKHLFGYERSEEGAVRDQIRKDVLNNFESVRVWLFDPPSDSTAVLKTKLTIGKCSPLFKSQVQTLRKVLSSQLLAPTLFGGQVMTARTLMALVSLVVGALNKGETVLPQSTYVSMMNTEMRQVRDRLCESMDEACEESLASLNINFTGEKAAVREFEGIIDGLISEYNSEARETVGELAGDLWNVVMGDSPALVAHMKSSVCGLFLSKYEVLLGSWLRKASAQVQVIYDEKIDRLKSLKWALSAADMGEKLKLLFDDCVARFDAADQDGDAVRSAIESFKNFTELRNLKFSESNTKKMLTSEAEVREMIRNAVEQMKREVDQEVHTLTKAKGKVECGYSRVDVESRLNDEYYQLDAKLKELLKGSPFLETVDKEFKEACVVLHKALCAEYEAAIDIAFTETVRKSCGLMDAEFQSLTPTPSSHAQWKVRAAAIYGSAEQSVSLWTLNPDDVETLLQPIRIHGDMLAKDLGQRVAAAESDREAKAEVERRRREAAVEREIEEKAEVDRRRREEEVKRAQLEEERQLKLENERRIKEEEARERRRQEELSAASAELERKAIAARLEEEDTSMDLDEDEEDDDEETEAPPKGSLGIQRHAVAQKEKAAKWARDQLGLKGVEVAPTPAGAKKMSALELAKEEHKIMQKQKLDLRVSTLKGKAKK